MRLRRAIGDILDFCFPSQCAACGKAYDSRAMFCDECELEMKSLAVAPSCEHCALPLTEHGAPCAHCQGKGVALLDRVVGLGLFRDPLKAAVHQAKYSKRWPLAEELADRLVDQERAKVLMQESEILMPVPLHRRRQMERGYNQADVIARRLGSKCGKPVSHATERARDTESQTAVHSRARRIENLRDAFVLTNPKAIAGKHVVLVDDVMTTGATLQSLARAIKSAGPASVSAIVLAIADPKGRGFEVI